jgi:hypothetical protein
MLRTTAIGLVSAVALGIGLASPAGAHMGGGFSHGGGMGHGGMMAMRTNFSSGRFEQHEQHEMGRMRMGDHDRDRDHERDRRDHDRFRFFPAFAFGFDTYSDSYDPGYGCFEVRRVWTHAGWRYRRIWVCD